MRIYSGPINVSRFGAKGDYSTDDTAAVHRASDFKYFANYVTHYFPKGTYMEAFEFTSIYSTPTCCVVYLIVNKQSEALRHEFPSFISPPSPLKLCFLRINVTFRGIKFKVIRKIILYVAVMALLSSQNIQAQWNEVGGLNGLAANGPIKTLCTDPAGNIYAAGGFRNASGKFYVAKWDGSTWSELGGLNAIGVNDTINSICSDAQGNIYAGGDFTSNVGVYIAKWDGNTWSALKDSIMNLDGFCCHINSICCDTVGNIYAVGNMYSWWAKLYIAKWNGNFWNCIGLYIMANGFNPELYTICSNPAGYIFTAGYIGSIRAKFYNGNQVSDFGSGWQKWSSTTYSICADNQGNVYAGGTFMNGSYPGLGHYYVAKGDGTTWIELGGKDALAANNPIRSVFKDASGRIFAGGDFTNSSGHYYIAKFDGVSWSELGGNNSLAANNSIRTICSDTAGNIYVAGYFTNANGKQYVAVISKALGINEAPSSSITLSPNPTTGNITIKGISQPSLAVYNLMGQKIVSSQGSNEVSLAQLPAGMYLVQVFNKDMVMVKSEKVVKE